MATRSSTESLRLMAMICVSAVTSALVTGVFLYALPHIRPELLPLLRIGGAPQGSSRFALPKEDRPPSDLPEDPLVGVVKRSQGAVVSVSVEATVKPALMRKLLAAGWADPTDPKTMGDGSSRIALGGGSGFFVTADGVVVTNRHVVDNQYVHEADDVTYAITLHDGVIYPAKLVASDPALDLAFLKIDANEDMPYLVLGDSDALQLGQTVIAIGNALEQFRNSVTSGIVSGLHRSILAGDDGLDSEIIEQAIQTDAAINMGNSGGPLLDLRGQVIGVNTAVSDSGQLLGFALPSNVVTRSLESVKRYGRVVRPFLGVRYVMVTEEVMRENGLKAGHGALVAPGEQRSDLAVSPGSPAEKAGIKEGDVIMSVGGREVTGDESLASLIGRYWPGDTAPIRLNRGGEEKTVSVIFTEFPK